MLKLFKILLLSNVLSLFLLTFTGCAIHDSSYELAKRSYAAQDYGRAFQQLWMPARSKDPRAQYAMGYMYYYGIGTDKDQDLGRHFIRLSAAQNYPPAIAALNLITKSRHTQYAPFEKYGAASTPYRRALGYKHPGKRTKKA